MQKEIFYSKLEETEAGREYLKIVQNPEAKKRSLIKEKGYEIHHIWSKALGGNNETENLVKLTVYDHMLAHYYLALALDCRETLYPMIILSNRLVRTFSDLEKTNLFQLEYWSSLREKANKMLAGRICINNSIRKKYVFQDQLQSYLDQGWVLGNFSTTRGRVTINDGTRDRKVMPEEVAAYEEQGWKIGSVRQGRPSPTRGKYVGIKRFMTNGIDEAQVKMEEQQSYLEKGWKYGRRPFSEETKRKLSVKSKKRLSFIGQTEDSRQRRRETGLGRIWIHLGTQDKWVTKEVAEGLIQQGWKRGRASTGLHCKGETYLSKDGKVVRVPSEKVSSLKEEGWTVGRGSRVFLNNGIQTVFVRPEKVQSYLDQGYVRGTLKKGFCRITKDGQNRTILPEELDQYLADGWVRGTSKHVKK